MSAIAGARPGQNQEPGPPSWLPPREDRRPRGQAIFRWLCSQVFTGAAQVTMGTQGALPGAALHSMPAVPGQQALYFPALCLLVLTECLAPGRAKG